MPAPNNLNHDLRSSEAGFLARRKRPRPAIIVLIALGHVALFYGLARALVPDLTAAVERDVVSAFTVTVTVPDDPPPPPEPQPEPDEGAQGAPGREAVPRAVVAPEPPVRIARPSPAPRASSTGTANRSGAAEAGAGTGEAGSGEGTGSGRGGSGQGGGGVLPPPRPVTQPNLVRTITDVRAFPIPEGGRKARIGKSVVVRLAVSPLGRVTGCSIVEPSGFPETDRTVCALSRDQVRFEPARDQYGDPIAASFLYRQRFFN